MKQLPLPMSEKDIIRLIGRLQQMYMWKQKAIYPRVTDPTLLVLENSIRLFKSYLPSKMRTISSTLSRKQLTRNGQKRTGSSGVISRKDFLHNGS